MVLSQDIRQLMGMSPIAVSLHPQVRVRICFGRFATKNGNHSRAELTLNRPSAIRLSLDGPGRRVIAVNNTKTTVALGFEAGGLLEVDCVDYAILFHD